MDILRAGAQLIPFVGGAIDTILSGRGSRLQLARLDRFIGQLHSRLLLVETIQVDLGSDEFFDFMITCLDKATRARTAEKSQRFAEIVATQLSAARPWADADMATRLLGDLEDIHLSILNAGLAAPVGTEAFSGMRVFALKTHPEQSLLDGLAAPLINELGSQYSVVALRMACSELTARGLLHDEGVGRWGSVAMTYFVATDLASWFADWLRISRERSNQNAN